MHEAENPLTDTSLEQMFLMPRNKENLCAKQRQSGALSERLRYNYNSQWSWILVQPVYIWSNHLQVRTIFPTQPVTNLLSRVFIVILLEWSLNLSFLCVNIPAEFNDSVAWTSRVLILHLLILMLSVYGKTPKKGLENLTFSSPTEPMCGYS